MQILVLRGDTSPNIENSTEMGGQVTRGRRSRAGDIEAVYSLRDAESNGGPGLSVLGGNDPCKMEQWEDREKTTRGAMNSGIPTMG